MNIILAWLCLLINTIQCNDLLLNGLQFPSTIYVPLDKSYLLECHSKDIVYWKVYFNNGKIQMIHEKLIRLNEFDKTRDGFYQCHSKENSSITRNVFIFSNGARSIDRHWTVLKDFHENLFTICRPMYFNDGFNEQFIELTDSKQTVRYNRSALLVKHIRSTTHLFCKLYLDTTCVGIRVQALVKRDLGSPFLSDQALKNNDYLEMKTHERDIHRIAFEDDSVYFHCPSKTNSSVQWNFLSFNYYLMKTLPILYEKDTKIDSVKITDAGLYVCQTENTIHKRIILTIIYPPKSPSNLYEHTLEVDFNSKHLICCHLDAVPYPTYSWSMSTEVQKTSFVWCLKRCCWLHVTQKNYENLVCTSANQFGKAKYHLHLIVHDTDAEGVVVYGEPNAHNHTHTNDFNLVRKIQETTDSHPSILLKNVKSDSSKPMEENLKTDNDKEEAILNMVSSSLDDDSDENLEREYREHIIKHEIAHDQPGAHINLEQKIE